MNTEIKPMIYKWNQGAEILAHDTYKGYEFAIISYGTHPCAYVGIPDGHRLYKKNYDKIDGIYCHGGFTFSEMGVRELMHDKWVIGWDYGHCGDYMQYYDTSPDFLALEDLGLGSRRWTTPEILDEVHEVIDQIEEEES